MKINNPFKWLKEKVRIILGEVDHSLFTHIDDAIMVAGAVKRLVNLPMTSAIIRITPTDMDNRVAAALNKAMDEVILILQLAEQCQGLETEQLRLKCFIEQIRKFHPELQSAIYLKIASLILHRRINGGTSAYISESTCDTLVQAKYWENKNS